MQSNYTYIPETNHVSREYSVAALLWLQFVVHITLFPVLNPLCFYISTPRSTCALPSMAVLCSFLISWFVGMLLSNFLNYFGIVPVVSVIIGITFVFVLHMHCIYVVRSLCFRILFLLLLTSLLSS